MQLYLKNICLILLLIISTVSHSQNISSREGDSTLWVEISLHHQIPDFYYFNNRIENGIFEKKIFHEGQTFFVHGRFKDFKPDGLWVAIDSADTPRLLALFRSDTIVFKHLNDSIGRPAHHFTYRNNYLQNEEWYDKGRLVQFDDYSETGCISTSYHRNMKHRLTFFINEKGIAYKKIVYDENGVFVKETYNVNE